MLRRDAKLSLFIRSIRTLTFSMVIDVLCEGVINGPISQDRIGRDTDLLLGLIKIVGGICE